MFQLILYPAKVQGDGASDTIVAGIKALDQYGVVHMSEEVVVHEDLWAFNEEKVARAIYEVQTPSFLEQDMR